METASRSQLQSRRQDEILRLTRETGRIEVTAAAERFDVTTETIRRDLSDLQERQLVRRVHGGAVPWSVGRFEPTLEARDALYAREKRQIATAAIAELPPEGTVILDSGSTTLAVAGYFPHDKPLRVITNSLLNARLLSARELVEVIVLGGSLRRNTMAMVDSHTVQTLQRLTVDTLFLGCDGISVDRGLTTPYQEEAAVKAAMIASARRVIALADRSKINNDQLFAFADLTQIDTFITDSGAQPEVVAAMTAKGLSVTLA